PRTRWPPAADPGPAPPVHQLDSVSALLPGGAAPGVIASSRPGVPLVTRGLPLPDDGWSGPGRPSVRPAAHQTAPKSAPEVMPSAGADAAPPPVPGRAPAGAGPGGGPAAAGARPPA